jgi:hypothetical protein
VVKCISGFFHNPEFFLFLIKIDFILKIKYFNPRRKMTSTKMNLLFKQIYKCPIELQEEINKRVIINYVNSIGGMDNIDIGFMDRKILTIIRQDKDIDLIFKHIDELEALLPKEQLPEEECEKTPMIFLLHKMTTAFMLKNHILMSMNVLLRLIKHKISDMTGIEYTPLEKNIKLEKKMCKKDIKLINNKITEETFNKILECVSNELNM